MRTASEFPCWDPPPLCDGGATELFVFDLAEDGALEPVADACTSDMTASDGPSGMDAPDVAAADPDLLDAGLDEPALLTSDICAFDSPGAEETTCDDLFAVLPLPAPLTSDTWASDCPGMDEGGGLDTSVICTLVPPLSL